MVRSIIVDGIAQHTNPVPNAALHNGLLCTSGILGKDPDTDTYPASIDDQAALCFHYLQEILTAAGASLQDVIKVDLYLQDKAHRDVVNRFWLECWPNHERRPARQAHEAVLPRGCLLQLTAMAVLPINQSTIDPS